MSIYLGTATPSDYKLGSSAVSAIYLGSTKVWPASGGAFTPMAVILTSGTSYTVPANATSMKAWAVGPGGIDATSSGGYGALAGAGGVAYKTWTVSGGASVAYSIGVVTTTNVTTAPTGTATTTSVTYSSTTIKGYCGFNANSSNGGNYTGGDGGAIGGSGTDATGWTGVAYGAVGGAATGITTFQRTPMTDVSGLKAAITLAGGVATETQGTTAAFGSGGAIKKFTAAKITSGYGGGWGNYGVSSGGGLGAVVLYFY